MGLHSLRGEKVGPGHLSWEVVQRAVQRDIVRCEYFLIRIWVVGKRWEQVVPGPILGGDWEMYLGVHNQRNKINNVNALAFKC